MWLVMSCVLDFTETEIQEGDLEGCLRCWGLGRAARQEGLESSKQAVMCPD